MKKITVIISILQLVYSLSGLAYAIQFEEVTDTAGVSYIGGSWGASWGDANGDGKPDLWVSDCTSPTRFRLNNGDGTFTDGSELILGAKADTHGAAWGDFDNDGMQDIIQLVGADRGVGSGPNQLFKKTGNTLQDYAVQYGLDYPLGRGRTPLWLDWNFDGYLDVFFANTIREDGQAPSALFTQRQDGFATDNVLTGITTSLNNRYAQLAHLTELHTPVLLIHAVMFPDRIYKLGSLPFEEIADELGFHPTASVRDTAIADFDGDLVNDIYMARCWKPATAVQPDSNSIQASIVTEGLEKGLSFSTEGDIQFSVPKDGTTPFIEGSIITYLAIDDIYIGQEGVHPSNYDFTVDPGEAVGLFPHSPGDPGVFIGYDVETGVWQILVNGFTRSNIIVQSTNPILQLMTIGFTSSDGALKDRLLFFRDGAFEDLSVESGLVEKNACGSVAAADFDNDMDIDLYLVCQNAAANLPNRLYENLGAGTFKLVAGSGGAEGSQVGKGDSVAIADYDEDGFVDLFVNNGEGSPPFDIGPDQLYRNIGNNNNWIEIDLEGVLSNRDGMGTRLFVTTAGITQFREQVGGMHAKAQNHQRVHVGLGGNERVDRLTVEWPSGASQEIKNISANQIIRVVEPSFPSLLGKPEYQPGQDSGVYLWKETFDGPYYLRVSGNGPKSIFKVDILSDFTFTSVVPVGLEANDNLYWLDNYLNFTSQVTTGKDGIDFKLPAGAEALIAVELDGQPNPRQLHVGGLGLPCTPAGWIVNVDKLPPMPDFQPGDDLGLFWGAASSTGDILMRWNGDAYGHTADLKIVSSSALFDVQPVNFESCCDTLFKDTRFARVSATMSTGWDGLDIQAPADSTISISYHQDGLFQSHRINGNTRDLGLPNAYGLPQPGAIGKPVYDPVQDKGIFIWRSENNIWHLRVTAGGDYGRYQGAIVSSLPVVSAQAWRLESNDLLMVSADQKRVDFDLEVWNAGQDGIDIVITAGSQVSLELNGNTVEASALVKIGAESWPVENLPVFLSK